MSAETAIATYFQLNDRQKLVHWLKKLPPDSPLIGAYFERAASEGKHKMLFDIISTFDVQKHVPEATKKSIINGQARCAKILSTFVVDETERHHLYAIAIATDQPIITAIFVSRWKWTISPSAPPIEVQKILGHKGSQLLKEHASTSSNTPKGPLEVYFNLGDHKQVVKIITSSSSPQQLATQYLARSIVGSNNRMTLALIDHADINHEGSIFLQQSIVRKNMAVFKELWSKCSDPDDRVLSCQLTIVHGLDEALSILLRHWSSSLPIAELFVLSLEQQNKNAQKILVTHLSWDQVLDVFSGLKDQPIRQLDVLSLFKNDLSSLSKQKIMVEQFIQSHQDSSLLSLLKLVHDTPHLGQYKKTVMEKIMANPNASGMAGSSSYLMRDFDFEKIHAPHASKKWKM